MNLSSFAQDTNLISFESPMRLFELGNEAYKADDFNKSIELYQAILATDHESWELHFNLGNAYFKLGNTARAILHYEKAKKLNPNQEDLLINLEMANLKTVDKVESKPELVISTYWDTLLNTYTIDEWAENSIILSFAALIIMILFLYTRGLVKKIVFFTSLFVFLVSVIFFMLGHQQKSLQTDQKYAIVFSPSVTVKGSPEDDGTKIFVIHEGTKLKVLGTESDWSRISLMNGTKGWVKSNVYEGI
jgi:tetratricopeptide (TPR) repeat protein